MGDVRIDSTTVHMAVRAANAGLGVGPGAAAPVAGEARSHDAALRKACEDLESVFLEQLLREMRKTVPKDDLFGGGRGEEVFLALFDQEIAKKMAERGGIGLGEVLYRQLSRETVPPSRLDGHDLGDRAGVAGTREKKCVED